MRRRIPRIAFLTAILVLALTVVRADGEAPWGPVSIDARRDAEGWRMVVEGPTGLPPGAVVRFEVLRLAAEDGEPFGTPETTALGTIDPEGRLEMPPLDRALPAGSYRVRLRVLQLDQLRPVERTIPPAFHENPADFACRAGSLAERLLAVAQDLTHAARSLAAYAQAYRAFSEAEARNRERLDRNAPWSPEEAEERRVWEGLRARHLTAVETLYVSWRDEAARPPALWRAAATAAEACPNLLNRELETWSVLIGKPMHGFVPFAQDPGSVATVLAEAHREAMLACLPLVEECVGEYVPEPDSAAPAPTAPDPVTLAALARLAAAWEELCAGLEPDGIPLADHSARTAAAARAFCDAPDLGAEALRTAVREARLALEDRVTAPSR